MVTPYLTFNGQCKDALDFYRAVFHCDEPKIIPYGDYMPEGSKTPPELLRGWVMHGEAVFAPMPTSRRAETAYADCIKDGSFIDPPYNTGNDFMYNDDFTEDTDEFWNVTDRLTRTVTSCRRTLISTGVSIRTG